MYTPLRHLFLLLPLLAAACGDVCIMFCEDQTRLQRQYVTLRDQCRELAEMKSGLKEGTAPAENAESKAANTRMVGQFSECMTKQGWAVPPPDEKKKDAPATGAPAPATAPAAAVAPSPMGNADNPRAQRGAECAFARQAAGSSVTARKRAEACDMECKDLKRIAPEAPAPAACP